MKIRVPLVVEMTEEQAAAWAAADYGIPTDKIGESFASYIIEEFLHNSRALQRGEFESVDIER